MSYAATAEERIVITNDGTEPQNTTAAVTNKGHEAMRNFATTAIIAALTIGSIGVTPASAEPEPTVDDIAAMTETIPQVDNGLALTPDSGGFTTNTVDIPANAGGELIIDTGIEIGIGLPGNASAAGQLAGDDVVFEDVARDTNIVAQATAEGAAQILITIDSAQAPTEFEFPIDIPDGAALTLNADGSVSIAIDGEELGHIETPWAVDANGNNVATAFAVNGATLTQIVNHTASDVAYPVVADPKFSSSWWGQTMKLTTSELKKLDAALLAGSGASAVGAAACAGLTGGLCALPFALGAALITFGRGAIKLCQNSRGVDIHSSKVGGAVWCSGY